MDWQATGPNPAIPEWAQDDCRLYALWPFANRCRSACEYCLLGRDSKPASRLWADADAVAGWQRIADKHGPCYILCGGREPTEELPLLADVLACHYGSIATNAMFDAAAFCATIPPERLELHPSFHAHLWRDLDEFLAKLVGLRGHGYRIPFVVLVGYPPYLAHWDEWIPRLRAEGFAVNLAPARNCTFEGRCLPEGYTVAERAILDRHIAPILFAPATTMQKPGGVVCAAGHAAFAVMADGTIGRCTQVAGAMGQQTLFDENAFDLLPGPLPCGEACCVCVNMWAFHL